MDIAWAIWTRLWTGRSREADDRKAWPGKSDQDELWPVRVDRKKKARHLPLANCHPRLPLAERVPLHPDGGSDRRRGSKEMWKEQRRSVEN